jgi:glycine cleavage system aminomethyltransferase T
MSFSIAIGPRIRKSPFFDRTVAAGVTHFSTYNHMYMPVNYGDALAEYDRLVNHVDIRDVAVQRQVRLKGPDALRLACILTPRNLDNIEVGKGIYMPICNTKGTLVNDPVLLRISEDELWLSIADNDTLMMAEGIAFAMGLDVDVSEPDVSPLSIQGPKSHHVAKDLFGDAPLRLSYFGFYETELQGIPLVVARSGWSKQGGYEFYLRDGKKGGQLWDLVMEAGKPYHMGPGAPNYIERVESGMISVNADTDANSNPFEMGLDALCDLDQEVAFVGKAALKKIKAEGARRRFCGIFMDGDRFTSTNENQWPILLDQKCVGYATAAAYSPRLDRNIAVCLVSTEVSEATEGLVVETSYGKRHGTITSLPFLPPSTKVPKELLS